MKKNNTAFLLLIMAFFNTYSLTLCKHITYINFCIQHHALLWKSLSQSYFSFHHFTFTFIYHVTLNLLSQKLISLKNLQSIPFLLRRQDSLCFFLWDWKLFYWGNNLLLFNKETRRGNWIRNRAVWFDFKTKLFILVLATNPMGRRGKNQ